MILIHFSEFCYPKLIERKKNVNAHNYGQWTWCGERPFYQRVITYLFIYIGLSYIKKIYNKN